MRSKLCILLACASLFALSGCYDIVEEVTITPAGGGQYVTKVDMGQLLSMFKGLQSESNNSDSSLAGQNMDTTLSLKQFADSAGDVDAETKALIAAITVHLIIQSDSNVFKMTMRAPFNSVSQLQKLQSYLSRAGGMQTLVRMLGNKGDDSTTEGVSPGGGNTDRMGQILQTQWSDHQIVRTINKPLYDSLMNDPDMTQFRQLASALGSGEYNTVIHLPRPALKVQSSSAHLSDDKKTVTFEHTLIELFDSPDHFTFTIDY